MAERVHVREIDDDEGRRLLRIIRRGTGSAVTWRRPQMVLLSANYQRTINTYVTNLRGPTAPLTFNGSPIREIIPVSSALGNVTVVFAVLSYTGTRTITIVADRDRCP